MLRRKADGEVVDLSDEVQVRAFFDRTGAFDHLVFCAGETLRLQTLEKMEFE
jgi:NAD(P)-dependent dehydrogenase (short-subunit alcohol dehydrogenase family)